MGGFAREDPEDQVPIELAGCPPQALSDRALLRVSFAYGVALCRTPPSQRPGTFCWVSSNLALSLSFSSSAGGTALPIAIHSAFAAVASISLVE
jgi:hypothetical protein